MPSILGVILCFGFSNPSFAEVSTLTLDSLSFISFQDQVTNPIAGGTLRFNFSAPNPDGSIPFSIAPSDVNLAPVNIFALNARLQYSLANQANGVMIPSPTGRIIVFNGTVAAQDVSTTEPDQRTYDLAFSTEVAFAENADGTTSVEREGVRVPPSSRYVQLVGATVNESGNLHGAAVYLVLSGSFDHLP